MIDKRDRERSEINKDQVEIKVQGTNRRERNNEC